MEAIAQTLSTIGLDKSICLWDNADLLWQKRIESAIAPGSTPSAIIYPNTTEELAQVLKIAHNNHWGVLICGSGSKLSWGSVGAGFPRPYLLISTERLNKLIEHAAGDLTVTVEAGIKFAELKNILATVDQFIAIDPTYPEFATIGGIIATADTGSLRHRYGGVRDMLIGLSFVRADGQIAKAGGRVVKNVAGYDLMKLFTGSYGTLGIISQVTFRIYPMPPNSATVALTGEPEALATATKTLLASAMTPTGVDVISTQIVANLGIGKGMGLIARFQSILESVQQQSARLLELGQQLNLQSVIYADSDESEIWQKLPEQIWHKTTETAIICKIGVLPAVAVEILTQLDTLKSENSRGLIHASSGLGLLQLDEAKIIQDMRLRCQSKGGFLTILEAPATIKQKIEVWGYTGNALDLMRGIKQQFDPENILNPNRFVGDI